MRYSRFDELASRYTMTDPKMSISKDGRIWLAITFNVPEIPVLDENDAVGIDLGCRRLATTSEGVAYSNADHLANRRRIRHNKR